MFPTLPQEIQDELQQLTEKYGESATAGHQALPLVHAATINTDGNFSPLSKTDRYGEVCMVVRRKDGRLLTMTKSYYPEQVYRLLTGGIDHGEGVLHALLRETHEETALDVSITRFLAAVSYSTTSDPHHPLFYTFAFLLDEQGGTLESIDKDEQVSDFREITVDELPELTRQLGQLQSTFVERLAGQWHDWGKFRAITHSLVYQALK